MLSFTPDVANTLFTLEIDISKLKQLNATAILDNYSGKEMVTFGEYMNGDVLITVVQDNFKHILYFNEQEPNLYVNTWDYNFVGYEQENLIDEMNCVVVD
jgi:hypothetical protein